MAGDGGTGGSLPEGLCELEACLANDTFRANCEREYVSCLDRGEFSEAECRAIAEETCTL
jgi:hypothetical protein